MVCVNWSHVKWDDLKGEMPFEQQYAADTLPRQDAGRGVDHFEPTISIGWRNLSTASEWCLASV